MRQLCSRKQWTESIAVRGRVFAEETKEQLGDRADVGCFVAEEGTYELREPGTPYNVHSEGENTYY